VGIDIANAHGIGEMPLPEIKMVSAGSLAPTPTLPYNETKLMDVFSR